MKKGTKKKFSQFFIHGVCKNKITKTNKTKLEILYKNLELY